MIDELDEAKAEGRKNLLEEALESWTYARTGLIAELDNIPEDKFEKEKGIVLGEIVQGRDWPGHYTQKALREALFEGSSLALPSIGTKSTIEHMVRDDVYDFYRHW